MGQHKSLIYPRATCVSSRLNGCFVMPASVEKSNSSVQNREAFRQPRKGLMTWGNSFGLQNVPQGAGNHLGDIFRPVIRLEHRNYSRKSCKWQREQINMPVKLPCAQKPKRCRNCPSRAGRNQAKNRLVAVQFHSSLRLQFQSGQMRCNLPPHQLASVVSQKGQCIQRIKVGWRAGKIATRYHQHKRIAQQGRLDDVGRQIQWPGRDANIKAAIRDTFQNCVAGHCAQRHVTLAQHSCQGYRQFWRYLGVEIIDDAQPQTAQAGDIHQGHRGRSVPQLGQGIAHVQVVHAAGAGQAQRLVAMIDQCLPQGGFKFFQLLRRGRCTEAKTCSGLLQAASAGNFLKDLKATQRYRFSKNLRQDNHFWLEYVSGQDALNNRGMPHMNDVFRKSFTQQEPISEAAIARASDVMRTGRLHRYNVAPGEIGPVAEFEQAFANWLGVPYALALTSGGQGLQIALRAAGVKPGDRVLTNGFTLAPVPGAIAAIGARPLLVETNENLRPDLVDLEEKAASGQARVLMLSNMRGHLPDMEAVQAICAKYGLLLMEDCAHTMGASWNGKQSGTFGIAGCFSTQTYKHMNSGEGGILTSDDPAFMARATVLSGSYMLYGRHGAGPDDRYFADARYDMPNCSARMDAVRATLLLDQLGSLADRIARWNDRYRIVESGLSAAIGITLPHRPNQESYVGSSIQFLVPKSWTDQNCTRFIDAAATRGVEVKWFGAAEPKGFTSRYDSWHFATPDRLPATDSLLARLFDMRLPLTFDADDCLLIAKILAQEFLNENRNHTLTGAA